MFQEQTLNSMGLLKIIINCADYVFTWFLAGLFLDVVYQASIAFVLADMDWTQMATFRPNFDKIRVVYKLITQGYWYFN